MDEQKKHENVSNKRLLDLLAELAQVQAENAMLSAKIFVREGREQIQGKVVDLSKIIYEQAENYGKKAQELAKQYTENSEQKGNIIEQYRQALLDIDAEYAKRMKTIMIEKEDWQAEEQEAYADEKNLRLEHKKIKESPEYHEHMEEEKRLASEIKRALDRGDLDTVTQKTEELKELKQKNPLKQNEEQIEIVQERRQIIAQFLEECQQDLEDCRNERFEQIEGITADKNNQLAIIPKQNVIQKVFGKIFNRLNGFSKFKNNVIEEITSKIEKIKTEQLPVIKETIQEKSEQFLETMQNRREQIKQKAVATRDAVTEKANGAKESIVQGTQNIKTTVQERASQTFISIINSGKQTKESIKLKLQKSLEVARERQEEKQVQLSENRDAEIQQIESEDGER